MFRSALFRSPDLSGPWCAGIAGDLGGEPEQVEVLPPHLQEDLALRVELEGFLEGFLDLVLVLRLVVVVVIVVVSRDHRSRRRVIGVEVLPDRGIDGRGRSGPTDDQGRRRADRAGPAIDRSVRSGPARRDGHGTGPATGRTARAVERMKRQVRTSRRRPGWSPAPGRCSRPRRRRDRRRPGPASPCLASCRT